MTVTSATIPGKLYIVATPIGNLQDISARAINILETVDMILAEDTRHAKSLLSALGLQKRTASLHAHNEAHKTASIITALQNGQSIALISDAGTPLINDPGLPLVKMAHEKNLDVVPIPGPCALITALSAAGIACDTFTFAGFLPAKASARQKKLHELAQLGHTVIVYESTHRILASLQAIEAVFGASYSLVLAKELTKTFETIKKGTSQQLLDWLNEDAARSKGEFVLLLPPQNTEKSEAATTHERLLNLLLAELPLKQAVHLACQITGCNKNELYPLALKLRSGQ